MNFVSFPDIFFPARTFFLAPISSVYMETIGSSLSGTLLNLHPPLLGPVRYTLRCLVAVPQDTDCVTTIKSTEEKLANKKKELETFQVLHLLKVWDHNFFFFYTYFFLQSEFCEIKKKYDAARERLENDVKEITELIQVCYLYM